MGIDVGFDVRHAVTMSFDSALQRYDVTRRNQFAADLIAKATALHGVTAAGVTTMLPLSGETHGKRVTASAGSRPVYPYYAGVSSGYFDAMRIPIVAGRVFNATDTSGSTRVAIVNQALARRLWPGQSPIGQHFEEDVTREVVGVARDGRYGSLTDDGSTAFYVPLGQADARERAPLSLVARTTADEVALLRSLEDAARTIDPDLPAFQAESLRDLVRVIADGREAVASLLGVFGLLTLAIAAIGIYGVAAHGAAMRRREVGLRMALGARPADVRRLFIRQSLGLAGVGVVIGCAISLAGSRLLTSFLFGVAPTDPLTFAGGALVLVLVAVAASYLPARAAARVNPVVALRQD
jgi:predicted permease